MVRRPLQQGLITLGLLAVALGAFRAVELLVRPRLSLVTWWDQAIPLVPASIIVYQSFFLWVIGAASWLPEAEARRVWRQMAVAVALGLVCFAIAPAAMVRPDPESIANPFLRQRFLNLWALDAPHNTFPSLHVAITWIVAAGVWRHRRSAAVVVVAAAITASTLTVKQHTLADVAGGMLLAAGVVLAEDRWGGVHSAPLNRC